MARATRRRFIGLFLLLALISTFQLVTAKPWKKRPVHPKMSLSEIQAIIDSAEDGDHIVFKKGDYFWLNPPISEPPDYKGAIEIIDKTLTIEGEDGSWIKGPPSVIEAGLGIRGVVAFVVRNPNKDKSVTFKNLNMSSFLMAIFAQHARDISILNCRFDEIHRHCLLSFGIKGNLKISDNEIHCLGNGIYLAYFLGTPDFQEEGSSALIERNIVFFSGSVYTPSTGIVMAMGSHSRGTPEVPACAEDRCRIQDNAVSNFPWGIKLMDTHFVAAERNTLKNIINTGIGVYAGGVDTCTDNRVSDNKITISVPPIWAPASPTLGLSVKASYNEFNRNEFFGTGTHGVFLYTYDYIDLTHNNILMCNDLTSFQPAPGGYHYVCNWNVHVCEIYDDFLSGITYFDPGPFANTWVQTICR